MATLVGGKPARMLVNGAAGNVTWSMRRRPSSSAREFLVQLAPYCFSPVSVIVAVVLLLVPNRNGALLLFAALCAGVDLTAPLLELDPRQGDLRRGGTVISMACSLWLWASTVVLLVIELSNRATPSALMGAYVRAGAHIAEILSTLVPA